MHLPEQRKAALRRIEMELDEADEMVSQMEIEVQGIPQALRPAYAARIKGAKAELARSKKAAKDTHAAAGRSELLGGGAHAHSDDPYGVDTDDRTRLLAGTATLEDGSRRLRESERIALETEQTGASILATLGRQREQIVNARETVRVRARPDVCTRAHGRTAQLGGHLDRTRERDAEGHDPQVGAVMAGCRARADAHAGCTSSAW
jgi:hypothetical protein